MDFTTPITADLSLGWKFVATDVHLQLEKSRAGFAAFGLGTGMSSGDLIVVETTGGVLTVKDCHLVGQTTPDCSEPQDWVVVEKSINASGFKVEIKRAATPSDSNDRALTATKTSVVYAYTDNPAMQQHIGAGAGYGAKLIDFSTGAVTIDDSPRLGDGTYMVHEHT